MKKTLLALLALFLFATPAAYAVDYQIEGYEMRVGVQSDGSADIVETLTYHFDGDYNGILSAFDVRDVEGLENLRLFVDAGRELKRVDAMGEEPFTYTLDRDDGFVRVRAYAPGEKGARVFRYEYTLVGLCARYQDAARLNYKLIGVANEETLRGATMYISLPGEVSGAWVHGAMEADDLRLEGNVVVLGPADVRPGRFVEADILFDADSLPDAVQRNQDIIVAARAQEAALAERAERKTALLALLKWILIAALVAIACGGAVMARRFGRTIGYKNKVMPSGNFTHLQGLHAATAQYLHANIVDTDALTGTLLELVQAKILEIIRAQDVQGAAFKRLTREIENLAPHQRYALNWLFEKDDMLWPDSLDANGDEDFAREQSEHMNRFRALVCSEADRYLVGAGKYRTYLMLPALLCALISAGLLAMSLWLPAAFGVNVMVVLIICAARLRRLNDDGELINAALMGVKEAAKRSDRLSGDFEWLIPISAALGCLEPFFERFNSEPNGDAARLTFLLYTNWHHDMAFTQRRMHTAQQHNTELLTPDASSSGDASSGGGGGGGGHGAW